MSLCIICNNSSEPLIVKDGIQYWQCVWCKSVFCEDLEQANKIGGEFEPERNKNENHLRIERIDFLFKEFDKSTVNILDFGCGHGYLVKDLKDAGYVNTDGYDAYNEEFCKLPERNKYDICIMVETIEHLSFPYYELDGIRRSLKEKGLVIIETGFVDICKDEGIEVEDYFYIEPKAGHSTIFSHHSLDLLMALKGFRPEKHFNRHVRFYSKVNNN